MADADVEYEMVARGSNEVQPPVEKTVCTAPELTWSNLNFSAHGKPILRECWGHVKSGEVCAIMGPSGAGKSSLLNVLAGRSVPAPGIEIGGRVMVNGKQINPVTFRQNIAYVMQDDALLATATPREAVYFSANMRLPSTMTQEELLQKTDALLEALGLTVCADVMIGGAMIKGISGGQRKRTSVGVEMITDPQLLFLDEPTSGLDSYTAYQLVELLKKVATKDTTILCTIHQPSSEVFFLFDQVIVVRKGQVFYHGAVSNIVPHFAKLGHMCPPSYNPSDFIMALTQDLDDETVEKEGIIMPAPEYMKLEDNKSIKFTEHATFTQESSFWKQIVCLAHRDVVNTYRDTQSLYTRFGVTVFLFLLFGLIFKDVGGTDNGDAENFNSHFGAVTMVLVSSMMAAAQPILLSFPMERPLFLREYATGTYGAPAYFTGKLLVEVPMLFIQNLLQFVLVYFLMDMQGSYILFVLASFGLGMASASVSIFVGCLVSDVKSATEISPLMFVPQMLFVGFFVATADIPVFLRWAQYLCSLKYAMNLFLLTEFEVTNKSCNTSPEARQNCEMVIENNDVDEKNYFWYALMLFALFLVFRGVGALALVQKAKRFY